MGKKPKGDLVNNQRCRSVLLAIEVGGRWSEEAAAFINNLARAKAIQAPTILQQSVAAALTACWSATSTLYNIDTNPPNWSHLLAEAAPDPHSSSRLPPPSYASLGSGFFPFVPFVPDECLQIAQSNSESHKQKR